MEELRTSGCCEEPSPTARPSAALAHSISHAEDGGAARAAKDALTRHQSSFCGVQMNRIFATALKVDISNGKGMRVCAMIAALHARSV